MPNTTLTPNLIEAVETLAENLLASEPFVAFEQAYARFEADPQASGLMRKLTQAQTNLRTHQSNGGLSQADIAQLMFNSPPGPSDAMDLAHRLRRPLIRVDPQLSPAGEATGG